MIHNVCEIVQGNKALKIDADWIRNRGNRQLQEQRKVELGQESEVRSLENLKKGQKKLLGYGGSEPQNAFPEKAAKVDGF